MQKVLSRYVPILTWGREYDRQAFSGDLIAALIVTVMLIPQSLAYALLAGLPPEAGLYASIAPIILYTIFGTSRSLAVGPVAVVSLMTAAASGTVVEAGTADYASAALVLAALSGGMLLVLGIFKLGFLANFLSHPVISGFISASGILIAVSQLKYVLGIDASGHTLVEIIGSLASHLTELHWMLRHCLSLLGKERSQATACATWRKYHHRRFHCQGWPCCRSSSNHVSGLPF